MYSYRQLPERVWSPFLQRDARFSAKQMAIATVAVNHPGMTQRQIAERVGCAVSTVNAALHRMKRLGILSMKPTRGRLGRTIARIRAYPKRWRQVGWAFHEMFGPHTPSTGIGGEGWLGLGVVLSRRVSTGGRGPNISAEAAPEPVPFPVPWAATA